ncbi:multidrug efflux protein, RND family [Novosphingobium nitrogenifigens DSM 19370]|uniref:Efflux pump membrane transporter n=1 Tax=Novosphingobium nitrogenifigens DSM 19370 TaxID=983920 RepID=F1ZBS3_9SPHN|nr:efflux RND transporter permease subunit [Novosphingobium nitrogenifigens]EGD58001.1 multidrug efflux protein, RND family [Novosphingobium nitrogenifigens DSM 19370]
MGISQFFVSRPIFAWVIAIVIMMAGIGSIMRLPVAQYPDVAPPAVDVRATYPGASAETLETSVTQVIEQQLTGIDNMIYFSSTSDSSGTATITVTFAKGTDPDVAQVQVQNKVQQATSRLPTEVQQQGLTVTKSNSDFLMIVGMYDKSDRTTSSDVADYLVSNYQDDIARLNGVGQVQVFGSEYAMRVWMDPVKLASRQLMPSDLETAIRAQNIDLSSGQIGALPALKGQMLNAVVKAKARLQTPEQFRNIVVKTMPDGSVVHLSDVARVELGQQDYSMDARFNGHPAAGMAIQLAPGADALKTTAAVKAEVTKLSGSLPHGYAVSYPRDTSDFVKLSIREVIETLLIAVVLVVIVMFIFLQSWRATLIPAIAVPVVLLGTFGVLALFGYSINTLTLFAMVLAIGLLVDDAIVVVENVERVMAEEGLDPAAATIKSMGEIGTALVGIALVLSAVMLPMAFFGGSTGVIYRQFSVTIVAAMALSVIVALVLSPALCATLLKEGHHDPLTRGGLFGKFNRWFDRLTRSYVSATGQVIHRRGAHLVVYAVIAAGIVWLFMRLPTGFLPTEDQGEVMVMFTLPAGATQERTLAISKEVEHVFLEQEKKDIKGLFTVTGFSFSGSGQNAGMGFASLAPFDDRPGAAHAAGAINGRAMGSFLKIRDAQVFALTPPAISGLGQSNGFTFELLNTSHMPRAQFVALRDKLIAAAAQDPKLAQVRASTLPDTPQFRVTLDDAKLAVLGLSESDATSTLSGAWGSTYVGDFVDRGRVKRVYIQADAPYRMLPDDLGKWFVRSSNTSSSTSATTSSASVTTTDGTITVPSTMVPFTSFTKTSWEKGANSVSRFNGSSSYEINGNAAPGYSSGDAMNEMIALQQKLAPGTGYAWSELSYQENQSSGQAVYLYALSILVVFLCLAALYESWSVPFAVMMVIPLGVLGAVLGVTLRGLENNIYFQVGLLTTIGLAAKNAILIVEFAEAARRNGRSMREAALEAAQVRLRPILMTSIAFIAGVLPLAVATGAGAQSRIAIGTAVLGGMITATALAIFYVPMFFIVIGQLFHRKADAPKAEEA